MDRAFIPYPAKHLALSNGRIGQHRQCMISIACKNDLVETFLTAGSIAHADASLVSHNSGNRAAEMDSVSKMRTHSVKYDSRPALPGGHRTRVLDVEEIEVARKQ